jgi:hypothetical protein
MLTMIIISYLFLWENGLNEILYLIQFKYYLEKI